MVQLDVRLISQIPDLAKGSASRRDRKFGSRSKLRKESSETNCTETKKASKRGRVGKGRPKEFAADTAKITGASIC